MRGSDRGPVFFLGSVGTRYSVPSTLSALPNFLVLDPTSTVRIDVQLDAPACEIDVALDNPRPGRSFVLLIGPPKGPYVQRVRLAGRARIHFDPRAPGTYSLLLANPQSEPIVVRLKARALSGESSDAGTARARPAKTRGRARRAIRPGSLGRAKRRRGPKRRAR